VALDDLASDVRIGGRTAADLAARLAELRRSVDRADTAVGDVLATYGERVDALLDDGTARVQAITDSRLVARAQSFESLTRTVEAVALQQGLLTPVVARGVFDPASYDRLVGAIAVERQWRRRFEQSAGPGEREAYDAALESPAVSVAERMLAEALRAGPAGAVAGDPDLWFTSSTRKVDVLSAAADDIAAGLTDAAEAARAAASRRQVLFVALGAAALSLIVALMALLQRIVVRPIRQLTAAAHDVADSTLPHAVALVQEHGPEAADESAVPIPVGGGDELGALTEAFNTVQRTAVALAAEQAVLRRNVNEVFVNLGRRTQNLITRQLAQIDQLEARTDDPDALSDLFLLDHFATRMRRNAENLLVIAGAESPRPWARPVSIVSVVRAAVAEATDYTRVDIERLAPTWVLGSGVSDISHLLAELVDNAIAYSPPNERVVVSGRNTHDGRYVLAVVDAGMGMPPDRLAEANARIGDPPVRDFAVSRFLGLYVVGRLAERHGIEVALAPSPVGGLTAHVVLPARQLTSAGDAGAGSGTASPAHVPPVAPPVIQRVNGRPTAVGSHRVHG
jgi:signal transduction histidine kinase